MVCGNYSFLAWHLPGAGIGLILLCWLSAGGCYISMLCTRQQLLQPPVLPPEHDGQPFDQRSFAVYYID